MSNGYKVCREKQEIHFPGVENARELGGYPTKDSRQIRRGMLYRTGMLMPAAIPVEEMKERLHVSCVVDFRTKVEFDNMPDPKDPEIQLVHLDVSPIEIMNHVRANCTLTEPYGHYEDPILEDIRDLDVYKNQETLYSYYANDPIAKAAYRNFFDVLLEQREGAVLFHCYLGKDRTGIAAALLLSVLGVDLDIIKQDYVLTNEFLKESIDEAMASARKETDSIDRLRAIQRIKGVELEMLEIYLAQVNEHYGSMGRYLREALGLTEEEIRILNDRYTEPMETQSNKQDSYT